MELNAELINQNEIKIDNMFISKLTKKRIKNELKDLYKCYERIELNLLPESLINIYENINGKIHKYSFIISETYPFKSPKIYYNDTKYSDFLKINNQLFRKTLQDMYKINCLYCHSFICNSNWEAVITIKHIINEIKKFKIYKKNIIYKIYTDKIKQKYLNSDIDLDSWLF